MPRGNGTGPNGLGTMTGRQLGYCAGSARPGYLNNRPVGRRRGRGSRNFARGGYRRNYDNLNLVDELTPQDELKYLEEEAKLLEERLELVQKNLKALKDDN